LFKRKRGPSPVRRSASHDWRVALPREKNQVFENIVRGWEISFAMMGISLDEALARRARGELVCAQQQIAITSELLLPFTGALINACRILADRGKHLAEPPIVRPLNTVFFRGDTAQSAASWNSLLHNVLLGHRSRFLQKLRILSTTIDSLGREFGHAAAEISEGATVDPGGEWKRLDSLHYDLNTCLREAEVILKSFLHSVPEDQLSAFDSQMKLPVPRKARPRQRMARISA
jgi:hypothetical protein